MNIKRILIIGGDTRFDYLLSAFAEDGYTVSRFDGSKPLKTALSECDAVVLGLPASNNDKTINAAMEEPILIKDLFRLIGGNCLLLAGKMSDAMKAVADVFSVRWIDYFDRGEFELLNAVPTCEGAIQIAMEELPITLHGADVVITGYGRIGKLLARDLQMLGANVAVCARSAQARAAAKTEGLHAVDFSALPVLAEKADVIFNTVPAQVINRNILTAAKKSLIIDLASKPGGVDISAAKDTGTRVIWALGLPGKVAPATAGNIIKETIYNIFSELGE